MRRGGLDALFFGIMLKPARQKLKNVGYFPPHDSAPHFEALPHRNSQQNKERRPSSALKIGITRRHFSTSGAPETFTSADAKITCVYVNALAVPLQAEGVPYCCLCFHETLSSRMSHSRPWPVGYGVLLGNMHVVVCRGADFRDNIIRI